MSKQVTITLTDEQVEQLNAINATRHYTFDSLLDAVIERGIYTLAYRTKYNAKQNALKKEFTAWKSNR